MITFPPDTDMNEVVKQYAKDDMINNAEKVNNK